MLDPGADDDGDGEINSIDVCPRVPSHDPHDEDQDGVPDACDLCPQFVDAGDDRDCDGLGAACDPDDSVPHTIAFHGFGSQRGIKIVEGFTVDSDDLHAVLDNSFAEAVVLASVAADGLYEGSFTVSGMELEAYGHVSIGVNSGAGKLRARLVAESQKMIVIELDGTNLATAPVGPIITSPITARMRLTVDGTEVAAELTGDLVGSTSATLPAALGDVTYGVSTFRDSADPLDVRVHYLLRIARL